MSRRLAGWWIALLVPHLAVAACGRPGAPADGGSNAGGPNAAPGAGGGAGSQTMDPGAQQAVDAAIALAVSRLGARRDQVRFVRVERRQWRNAALGCPEPDMMYAQVITPGYLVILSVGGQQVEFHTDTRGRAVTC